MNMRLSGLIFTGILIGLLVSFESYGQKKKTEAADKAFTDQQYFIALDKYKKTYSKIKNNKAEKSRVAFQIAECYRFINDFKRAEPAYKRVIRMEYQRKEPIVLLYYADMLKSNESYEEAMEYYNLYTERVPDDPRGPDGAESCRLTLEWLEQSSKYQVENVKKVNTKMDDFAPSFADKFYSSIVFTTTRDGVMGKGIDEWTGQNFSDLYYAKLDRKGAWSTPVSIEKEQKVNTEANEGVGTFNSSFNRFFFTRCGNVKGEKRGCQIYESTASGKTYGTGEMIALFSDTNVTVGHPTFSDDDLIMVFSSDKEGGQGGKDLWIAKRKGKDDEFGVPLNLGPVINTVGDEMFPFLRHDTILYFASNRHLGMGGLDIFKSSFVNNEWTQPVNLKPPVNSSGDDFAIVFRPEEESGFFSSNRNDGRGGDDIYSFVEPPLEYTLQGVVKDDLTLLYIEGAKVKLVGSNGTSIQAKTDVKGYYNFGKTQIAPNTSYEIIVDKENYFTSTGKITTVGEEGSKDFVRDFLLVPIPAEPIVLPDILYELDKWNLQPQYQDSLQGLIQTLDQNPTIIIELASHTDARASDEYNDILSQRRAESVVNYLIERGIDPERLVAKGYGERVPRTLSKDIDKDGFIFKAGTVLTEAFIDSLPNLEVKEAAHQMNRRTEFRVLSKDFIPKPKIEELPATAQIEVVTDLSQEDRVQFTPGKGEAIMATCVINGYTTVFTYIRNARGLSVSVQQALEFLKEGAITKKEFEGDPNTILSGGTIVDRSVFTIKEIRIGNKVVNDIQATVYQDLETPFLFGESVLQQFGKFTIDKERSEIVFE
jgi:peptidoglycan-associated lipoprotein